MIARFGCRCIAVEANPVMCALIPEDPLLTVVNAAVSAESGMSSFYICKNDEASSLLRPSSDAIREEISIPCVGIPELLTRHDLPTVDLLKVDIEGV
jgi:FkbM family methyltransferase